MKINQAGSSVEGPKGQPACHAAGYEENQEWHNASPLKGFQLNALRFGPAQEVVVFLLRRNDEVYGVID